MQCFTFEVASTLTPINTRTNLCRNRWMPGANGHPPVDSFKQHGQLRRGQRDRSRISLRPDESAFLQSLGKQAHALTIPPQQLDDVAALSSKHKDVAREGILRERALHQRGQTIKAAAHVRQTRGQPHACSRRQTDHATSRRVCSTQRTLASSTAPHRRTRAPPNSISMTPTGVARAAALPTPGGTGLIAPLGGDGSIVTGSKTTSGRRGLTAVEWPSCWRLHLNTRFAFTPCSSAMAATEAPLCSVSTTSLRLNAALCLRFVVLAGEAGEAGACMVCTYRV